MTENRQKHSNKLLREIHGMKQNNTRMQQEIERYQEEWDKKMNEADLLADDNQEDFED